MNERSESEVAEGQSRPMRDLAYRNFTDRLMSRDIRPGQFVSQRELVAMTGMPLGAIRELVPRLEADGLIKTVPKRGMQVAHVDLDLIRNAFQFRLMMEREAVAEFVRTAPDDLIAGQLQQHLEIAAEAKNGVSPALLQRAQTMDWYLHDLMIDRLGNEIISNAYRINSIKIRLISFERVRLLPELVVSVMTEHLPILEAATRRDVAGAVAAMEAHIASARARALAM
jgi:DNA-binding GntR family transcriptional regulator